MREEIIRVTPFKFLDYLEIEEHQCVGMHGTLKIVGHISPEDEQEYIRLMTTQTWVSVDAAVYEGTMRHMFEGIIQEADIEKINGTCILTLQLITESYLMDQKRHIRSFQQEGTLYRAVMDTIMEGYSESRCMMTAGEGAQISGCLLQYHETDWEFARRLASHFGTDIYADCYYRGIELHLGEPKAGFISKITSNEYSVIKNNESPCNYLVKLREIHNVGEWVNLNGIDLWIAEAWTKLEGNELYHTYRLVNKGGMARDKKYNEKCTGASLTGVVTAVEKDKVQVELEQDENKAKAGRRWFDYATPYSTPDGTGWYCMPEAGDKIRLRIPTEDESGAYVVSSVHVESSNGSERKNPDYKSIMNKHGKEILLTPKSLIMTNNAGMSIEILDEEGIKIISDKNIAIEAADAVEITSANSKLELYAKDNILLKQGNIQMNMDGEMRFYGARLNLN